ncbi:MAG TPA: flavin reductase family protein [Terriglobales bacterium]|nr:flavin reductase family protein [Terriglobales bacterium]
MDPSTRKKTLRLFSNGVYIITSRHGDHFGAATVTWVSQASFKPPLLMAALRRDSNVFQCLTRSRVAAIHIVNIDQQAIAQRFFSPTDAGAETINGQPYYSGKTSAPILRDLGAYVECRVRRIVDDEGDHALVILEVLEAECLTPVQPLTIRESPWEYGG